MLTYILFWSVILTILTSISIMSLRNGITPTPTGPKSKKKIANALRELPEGEIYELGSGWGTVALMLAKKYPKHNVHAIENSFFPYLASLCLSKLFGYKNLYIERRDFFEVNLKDAVLVYCYLYSEAMEKLKTKFENELPNNTIVISNTFAINGWKPQTILTVNDLYNSKIYFYKMNRMSN